MILIIVVSLMDKSSEPSCLRYMDLSRQIFRTGARAAGANEVGTK